MGTITFKSSRNDILVINGNKLTVTNVFGDTYRGMINSSDKVETKSRLGLGYLSRAYSEYKLTKNIQA